MNLVCGTERYWGRTQAGASVGESMLIVALLGLVALGVVVWLGIKVRRELLRRRRVARVRAQVEQNLTVDELRRRCAADSLPRYPGPSRKGASAA